MKCLETNQICSEGNRKCKECKLKDCKETLNMIDYDDKKLKEKKLKLLKEQLPIRCQSCSFLEVINLDKQIVKCPYLVKNKCLIK